MHDSISLYIIKPQSLHFTLISVEKISTSSLHTGQFFILREGVRILTAPGHLSNIASLHITGGNLNRKMAGTILILFYFYIIKYFPCQILLFGTTFSLVILYEFL